MLAQTAADTQAPSTHNHNPAQGGNCLRDGTQMVVLLACPLVLAELLPAASQGSGNELKLAHNAQTQTALQISGWLEAAQG